MSVKLAVALFNLPLYSELVNNYVVFTLENLHHKRFSLKMCLDILDLPVWKLLSHVYKVNLFFISIM